MSKTNEPTVRDEVIGFCGKSCGGDLHPLIADGAWSAEKCLKCNGSWWFQVPRKIDEIEAAAVAERKRREEAHARCFKDACPVAALRASRDQSA